MDASCLSVAQIMALHKQGVFTAEEVRRLIFKMVGDGEGMVGDEKNESPAVITEPAREPAREPKKTASKKRVKRNMSAASPETSKLRRLSKQQTRNRFFAECQNPKSCLWDDAKNIKTKLFEKATEEPLSYLFHRHSGILHKTSKIKLRQIMKWQVGKDRSNWKGKTPSKKFVTEPNTFNFAEEERKLAAEEEERKVAEAKETNKQEQKKAEEQHKVKLKQDNYVLSQHLTQDSKKYWHA